MYNGIGLHTPRGSGTNGHVQRNCASIRPIEKTKAYSTEELSRLDQPSIKQPNKDILDHERKRKIELKCAEFAELLEDQGFSEESVNDKVNNYRKMLLKSGSKPEKPVNEWGKTNVVETHQVAEAQQEKNARLREAFGISEYFMEGSSFDADRQAKEQLAADQVLAESEKQRALEREKENQDAARYQLVRTPTPDKSADNESEDIQEERTGRKKKYNRSKEKKKSKHHKEVSSDDDYTDESEYNSKKTHKGKKSKINERHFSESSESSSEAEKNKKDDRNYRDKRKKNIKTIPKGKIF
ncbi:unnamed protein product [Ceutorhynchus assimilis]|uniref:CWF21 domain-containing protein n=1 Tax=Ceutorhynchus assimilis TaxID=467358 RepID=A0A9N9MZ85_9CUCU|nr:unnamed protein product [Ceutorhynchus assimilis]